MGNKKNRPYILITTSNVANQDLAPIVGDTEIIYSDRASAIAVLHAGGLPLYMPALYDASDATLIDQYLDLVSGVFVTGADTHTDPKFYGEDITDLKGRIDSERDSVDIPLIQRAHSRGMPIIGICKGMQLINVALGGSLYQNVFTQHSHPKSFNHSIKNKRREITHSITLPKDSLLRDLAISEFTGVNGGHEQGVKVLASSLDPAALSDDEIVEAFQSKPGFPFVFGTQFHCELMTSDPNFSAIIENFISQCTAYK